MFLKSTPSLVLASTSAYRRALLERLGLPFTCLSPEVDETPQKDEAPLALASRLARAKAERIASRRTAAWVIGSDQVAVLGEVPSEAQILGKPGSAAACIAQLEACSARSVAFLTAVAVLRQEDGTAFEFVDTTRVRFRRLEPDTIARYVELESPLDCAGGFKCEGLGISLCDSIESVDPTALIGLPLIRLAAVLREVGFQVP
ncbi:MAG: nucleoside triphosphate pyrophosphatase [Steroidobacteraceae bacterium]